MGKGVIKVVLNSSYAYWKRLYPTHEAYEAEKQRVAATLADELEALTQRQRELIMPVKTYDLLTFPVKVDGEHILVDV